MLSRKEHLVLAALVAAGLTVVFPSARTQAQAQCKKGPPVQVVQQRNCNNTSTITQQRNGGQQISLMLNLQQQNQLQKSQLQQGQLQQGQLQQGQLQQARLQQAQLQRLQLQQLQQSQLQHAQVQQRLQNQQRQQLQLQQGLLQQGLLQQGLQQQSLRQQQNLALLTQQQQQNLQQQNQQNGLQNGQRNQPGPQRLGSKELLTALEKQRDKNDAAIRFDQQGGQMTDKQRRKNVTDLRTALERTGSLLDGMEGQRHEQEALDLQSTLMQQQSTMRNALLLAGGA